MSLPLKKLNFSDKNIINFLFASFPISFIAGNPVTNLNVIFLISCSLFFFKKKIFQFQATYLDKFFFIFFSLVLFTGFYNNVEFFISGKYPFQGFDEIDSYRTIIKSLLFLRYLLLYLVLKYLIEKKIINLKLFFFSSTICILFVSLDLFLQYVSGKDIFGYEVVESSRKLGGPFGEELIAGGYLQRFSLFGLFIFSVVESKKFKKFSNFIIVILFIIISIGIILSGNRMPTILFFFSIILTLMSLKNLRKFFLPFILITIINFSLILNFNKEAKINFNQLKNEIYNSAIILANQDFKNKKMESGTLEYIKVFISFYDTWTINKYIGGGIKNFRYYCLVRPNKDRINDFTCNMHPHNYYLEILTDTGVAGFVLLIIVYFLIIKRIYLSKFHNRETNNNFILPFIFLFLVEIFPLRSSGSFFTTSTATYFFIIISVIIALTKKYDSIENKK